MSKSTCLWILLLGLCTAGCSSLERWQNGVHGPLFGRETEVGMLDCDPDGEEPPKTLLKWNVKEPEEDKREEPDNGKMENEGKNGIEPAALLLKRRSAAEPNSAIARALERPEGNGEDEDEIVTDRPDFTEASSTVGRGRVQLEAGYTLIRDRSGGVLTLTHSYPEMLFRIGMFREWFELRIGQNFASQYVDPAMAASGATDLYLGVKLGLTEQAGIWPESALILQMTVPTGHPAITANRVLPGLNYLFGWDIIPDRISAGGSLQANQVRGDVGGHTFTLVAQSMTVGYTLTKKLGAYTEWFAFYPSGAIGADDNPQHFIDGGFTYKLLPNLQFDIRAGLGLNEFADDFFIGAGFAARR